MSTFQVLELGGDKFKIYDSRAAAYQKLDKLKDALRDAKSAIDLQPDKWQVRRFYLTCHHHSEVCAAYAGLCAIRSCILPSTQI